MHIAAFGEIRQLNIGDGLQIRLQGEGLGVFWQRCVEAAVELRQSDAWRAHYSHCEWRGVPLSNTQMHLFSDAADADIQYQVGLFCNSFDAFLERVCDGIVDTTDTV